MKIRFANENDISEMMGLLIQVHNVHNNIRPDLFRPATTKYTADELKKILADDNRPIFCADDGGKMVGYCFCVKQEIAGDPFMCDRKSLYIDDLCVDESYRGKGVAKQLFDAVVSYAHESACSAVTLNVWEGNDRAYHFYQKYGMKVQKTVMEYILD